MQKGARNKIIIGAVIAVIIIGIVLGVKFLGQNEEIPSEKEIPSGKQCNTDSDCVKTRTTCCACNMGGTEICVGKGEVDAAQKKLLDDCPAKGLICLAVYNCDSAPCRCVEGNCIV